jgi:hypothetical protein
MRMRRAGACSTALLLAACAGDGDGLDENGRPAEGSEDVLLPEFSSIQSKVFTPICTTCHAGSSAPLGLRLEADAAYAMLVNAPSAEVPGLLRIAPGNPDASYLIHKLEGTATVGGRMPLNGPPLPAETIAVIRQWISDGAPQSASLPATSSQTKAATLDAVWPLPDSVMRESARSVVLSASMTLDTTILDAGVVTLRRSGGDGDFLNGDEQVLHASIVVRSSSPTVLALTAPASEWVADRYELRVSGGSPLALADLASRPIDGDGNGEPGGDFVLRFIVEETR